MLYIYHIPSASFFQVLLKICSGDLSFYTSLSGMANENVEPRPSKL